MKTDDESVIETGIGVISCPPHLQPPRFTKVVREWIDARFDRGADPSVAVLEALGGDCPPEVLAFRRAWDSWRMAVDAWRGTHAIDINGTRWRMFGGDWIPVYETVRVDDYATELLEASRRALKAIGPERFHEYALAVYEVRHMRRRAEEALAVRIREATEARLR